MTALIVVMLAALVTAHLVRDRTLGVALLMFVPIWPFALCAAIWDVSARGRALPLPWLLLTLGVGVFVFSGSLLWQTANSPEGSPESQAITIAQWNVQWGGAHGRTSLASMLDALEVYQPDVVCLSEVPTEPNLRRALELVSDRNLHVASVEHERSSAYWFRLTVLSASPVVVLREWNLSNGHAALFEVALQSGPLRVMMVDLQSPPLIPRSPTISEVARIVNELARAEVPVHIVAGDFNTPGRFIGFDALSVAADGYRRSAMWSGQWRATWPASLPLSPLDIDHVWVSTRLGIASAEFFSNPNSDHRGQVAVLRLP